MGPDRRITAERLRRCRLRNARHSESGQQFSMISWIALLHVAWNSVHAWRSLGFAAACLFSGVSRPLWRRALRSEAVHGARPLLQMSETACLPVPGASGPSACWEEGRTGQPRRTQFPDLPSEECWVVGVTRQVIYFFIGATLGKRTASSSYLPEMFVQWMAICIFPKIQKVWQKVLQSLPSRTQSLLEYLYPIRFGRELVTCQKCNFKSLFIVKS